MERKLLLSMVIFLLALIPFQHSAAQNLQYLPLTKAEIGKPFPMQRVKAIVNEEPISFTVSAGPSGTHFEVKVSSQTPLSAHGKDINDYEWRVSLFHVFPHCVPIDFYETDLDKNGFKDVLIIMPTCGVGLAPTVHLIALMFDKKGRPIPFEADGYFETLTNGVDSLVDMNNDVKAELIYMNFNDGYWITNIYQCQDARWHRVEGQFGKRKFPLFTRFTYRPNKKPVIPKVGRHPFAPNLSNNSPIMEGYLSSFYIPEKPGVDVELIVEDLKGASIKCTPAYWYDSARVILDIPNGRQIGHLASDDKSNASSLLKEIIAKRIKVVLYGQRYPDKCSPELVWAEADK